MVVFDTNIIVSLLKGEEDARRKIGSLERSGERISITAITAYELLKGAQISSRPEENLARVRELISNLQVLGLTIGSCEEASRIYRELRQKGKMIGEFDILIAAIVKTMDEKLVSEDADFKAVRGLEVVGW